jgi:diguanylate cyclase (GGDEF)-like protein
MRDPASSLTATAGYTPGQLAAACTAAGEAISAAPGPAAAVEAAIDALHEGLDAAFVAVFVLEHGQLWSIGVRGQAMIPDGLPLDQGVIGRAVREREPQFVLDVSSDPDFMDVHRGAVSELAIPLLVRGDIVGIVNIETVRPLAFGAETEVDELADTLATVVESLRSARTVDLSSLARLFVRVSSLRDPAAIAQLAVRALTRVLPIEAAQVMLRDDAGRLASAVDWRVSDESAELLTPVVVEALLGCIDSSAVLELLDASATPIPELAGTRTRSVVLLPLRANGKEIGVLLGASRFARRFEGTQGDAAALLAAHAAASLDAALALGKERRSALTDPLTGLLNRRGLEQRLETALEAAQSERQPLSLVVLDCDDFKDVNDRAGHEFGDALLREIGDVLRAIEPHGGCSARLGGDEFVVILPATDAAAAETIAAELAAALAAGLDEAGFPLHLSAGVSTYPYDGAGASQLVRAADQALYEAKARGKNRVVGFRDLLRVAVTDELPAPVAAERRRAMSRSEGSTLEDAMTAATAIWDERTPEAVLHRLGRSLTFVIGATGAQLSRVDGNRLLDAAQHALRHVDLGDDVAYLIDDFPVTREVLAGGKARALSFLDDDLDPAEAFVLRGLKMNSCLMLPIHVHRQVWGLVELYDMRLRRFARDEVAVAEFLAGQAGRRLESLDDVPDRPRPLPLFRLPSTGI